MFTHNLWFPSVLQELDPRGAVRQEYWSNGFIDLVTETSWNGRPVVLVGATNNDFRAATAPADAGKVLETERQMFSLREGDNQNPYSWDFDLCSLTLGNFNYRKMTLVRDYAKLIETDMASGAFDTVFSLTPKPPEEAPPPPLELADQHLDHFLRRHPGLGHRPRPDRRQLHHSRAAGHGQVADDHEPHRRLRGARKASAVCMRKAGGDRRGIPPAAAAGAR